MNKESIKKDYPRVCAACGGKIITIYRAVRGSAPRLFTECKVCKDVREILQELRRVPFTGGRVVGAERVVLPYLPQKILD